LKGIVFKVILEDSTRMIALETGEIDVAAYVPSQDVARVNKIPGVHVEPVKTPRVMYVALNNDYKPFNDVRVRKAVNLAFDSKGLINALFEGKYALECTGHQVYYVFGSKTYPKEYNVAKAKKLLAEAGYPNGFSAELWTMQGRYPMDKEAAILVAHQLGKNLNIKIDVKVFEYATLMSRIKKRVGYPLIIQGWGSVTGDSDAALVACFHSRERVSTKNIANYSNPEFDDLVMKARKETDQNIRKKLYHQAMDILERDCPWIPIYNPMQLFGIKDKVKGFAPRLELIRVEKCWVEK